VDLNIRVDPSVASIRKDMIFLILETLERTITPEVSYSCQIPCGTRPNSSSWQLRNAPILQHFVDLVARRWTTSSSSGGYVQDSIVSTNYDVLVEKALARSNLTADYALPEHRSPSLCARVKLLKLHGSANWSLCKSGEHVTVHPLDTPISVIEAGPCGQCGSDVEPFVVPPTWSKGEHRAALESLWKVAFDELVSARRWIFIGTSLPETDRFLVYLFGLALQRNAALDSIVILNLNSCGYDQLFAEHASKIEIRVLRDAFESAIIQGQRFLDALGYTSFKQPNPLW
jgi:hypothetical protein